MAAGAGESTRTLSPLGLVIKGGLWYLVARPAGRGAAAAPRTYRVGAIHKLQVLATPARRPPVSCWLRIGPWRWKHSSRA